MYESREYQELAINRAITRLLGSEAVAPILVAPTGSGKTFIGANVVQRLLDAEPDLRVIWCAPRRELVSQAAGALERVLGYPVGIIMAGHPYREHHRVQVASLDTLHARAVRKDLISIDDYGLIVVDECHLSLSRTRRNIVEMFKRRLGLSATPARGDGKALGALFDGLIEVAGIRELTEQGYLLPVRTYRGQAPDTEGVKLVGGDYVVGQLEKVTNTKALRGDAVKAWKRYGEGRTTVAYCVTVAHAQAVAEDFEMAGYRTAVLTGETPLDEREKILKQMDAGEIDVCSSVYVLSYGWDCPRASCALLLRPTRSIVLFKQQVGRILRPYPDQDHAVLIDLAGCTEEHGLPDREIPWSLSGDTTVQERIEKKKKGEPKEFECPACGGINIGVRVCVYCGHECIPKSDPIPFWDVDVVEVVSQHEQMRHQRDFYLELRHYAKSRDYAVGWCAHTYKKRYGSWPGTAWKTATMKKPTQETLNYIRHQQIKWAKGRSKARRLGE